MNNLTAEEKENIDRLIHSDEYNNVILGVTLAIGLGLTDNEIKSFIREDNFEVMGKSNEIILLIEHIHRTNKFKLIGLFNFKNTRYRTIRFDLITVDSPYNHALNKLQEIINQIRNEIDRARTQ
jgi:hypothetical protein